MKLLFDENISYRILPLLKDYFEQVESIFNIKSVKEDIEIWNYAKRNGFTIVTFDEDFYDWQLLKGFPPKIIWLRMGNSPTKIFAGFNSTSYFIRTFKKKYGKAPLAFRSELKY